MTVLNGKLALVTGGGSGMGRAIVHQLADAGCQVVAIGRTRSKLQETLDGYTGKGRIAVRVADVSSREQVAVMTQEVHDELGPADILVNNAGINIRERTLEKLSLDDWDKLIQVNLTGAFHMVHAILPQMRKRRDGLIIHVSSIAGVRASALGGAAYSASKFGLTGLSGVISLEEAANGIRSTLICPGEVNTPILDDRPEPVSAERRAAILQPEDIAAAVLFVASLPARANVPELIIKPTTQAFA